MTDATTKRQRRCTYSELFKRSSLDKIFAEMDRPIREYFRSPEDEVDHVKKAKYVALQISAMLQPWNDVLEDSLRVVLRSKLSQWMGNQYSVSGGPPWYREYEHQMSARGLLLEPDTTIRCSTNPVADELDEMAHDEDAVSAWAVEDGRVGLQTRDGRARAQSAKELFATSSEHKHRVQQIHGEMIRALEILPEGGPGIGLWRQAMSKAWEQADAETQGVYLQQADERRADISTVGRRIERVFERVDKSSRELCALENGFAAIIVETRHFDTLTNRWRGLRSVYTTMPSRSKTTMQTTFDLSEYSQALTNWCQEIKNSQERRNMPNPVVSPSETSDVDLPDTASLSESRVEEINPIPQETTVTVPEAAAVPPEVTASNFVQTDNSWQSEDNEITEMTNVENMEPTATQTVPEASPLASQIQAPDDTRSKAMPFLEVSTRKRKATTSDQQDDGTPSPVAKKIRSAGKGMEVSPLRTVASTRSGSGKSVELAGGQQPLRATKPREAPSARRQPVRTGKEVAKHMVQAEQQPNRANKRDDARNALTPRHQQETARRSARLRS
ncbi:hypothetical protein BKA62DRAFT_772689 [Auriculariales sp. MPI-PUGE-AT-0066]|nr:hypothetical protein BKA62DRAFT_772689 [Auriculariales sp. MPI-PUGE-AT-0066]